MLKSIYRREPVVSFVVTIGAINALLGGVTEHLTLLSLGLSTVGVTVLLRWWMLQQPRRSVASPPRPAVYALPSARPSRPPLHLPPKARPLR